MKNRQEIIDRINYIIDASRNLYIINKTPGEFCIRSLITNLLWVLGEEDPEYNKLDADLTNLEIEYAKAMENK